MQNNKNECMFLLQYFTKEQKWLCEIKLLLPLEDGFGGGGGGGGKSMSSYVSCSGSMLLNQQNQILLKMSEIICCSFKHKMFILQWGLV